MRSGGVLRAYTRKGVVEIPLTGDPDRDALLERLAKLGGGAVTRQDALFTDADADALARAAMRDDDA